MTVNMIEHLRCAERFLFEIWDNKIRRKIKSVIRRIKKLIKGKIIYIISRTTKAIASIPVNT